MKHEKGHRYVSTRGPLAGSPDRAITRAIAVAENEGWPIAAAQRHVPPTANQLQSAKFTVVASPR